MTYAFDSFGRMTSASIPGHTLSYAFDQLSRVLSQTNPRGTLSYQYDLAGRRTRVTHPDAFYADYDFDLTDEVTTIRVNGATSGVGVAANYGYDDLGRRTGVTRAGGAGVATSYGYDGASRLTSLAHDFAGSTDDQSYGFTYNAAGEILTRTSSNSAYAYPTPAVGSLSYTDNGLNQYTTVGAATPTYDARGNITYDGARNYTYDPLNRLLTAGSGSVAWDPVGRMASYTDAGGAQNTLWDGASLAIDYTSAGAIARRYVEGPGVDEPVVWYEGSGTGTPYFATSDQIGSVVAWSNASGAPTQINKFDEYGKPASGNAGRFQFTGQTWFAGAMGGDIYYYKARAYSATLGRFLQTDPILYGGGTNLYAYVANDPQNWTDPSGLDPSCAAPPPTDEGPGTVAFGSSCSNSPGSTVFSNASNFFADWLARNSGIRML
ncbi:MAG: RHS repeat-associated core domain-containing protein, partial [Vicinamibacterales bacterium]